LNIFPSFHENHVLVKPLVLIFNADTSGLFTLNSLKKKQGIIFKE